MKSFFYLLVVSLTLISCSDDENAGAYNGSYAGTFYRVTNGVKGQTSNVTLNLHDNKYTGSSSIEKYPAICAGKFVVYGNELEFTNTCAWTAEFDWTLILQGEFKAKRTGDTLALAKAIDPQNGDYYLLRRQ